MKRSMDVRWAEVRVGLVLILALVLLGAGIFMIGEKTRLFTPTTTVEVVLPEVQGLKEGAPVWLSGLVIGTVEKISFAHPLRSDRIVVTLSLEADAARRLGQDAAVTIQTRGLLGEKYVDISPGEQHGVPKEPLQGQAPRGIDQIMERAYSAFERLAALAEKLEGGEGSLTRLVEDPALYDNLVRLTGRLQEVTTKVAEGDGSLARLLEDPTLYERFLAFADRGQQAVAELESLAVTLKDPQGTIGRLAHDRALYDEGLATLSQTRRSMVALEDMLARVQSPEGTLGRLITDDELHRALERTLRDFDALLRDLQENPGRYVDFSLF